MSLPIRITLTLFIVLSLAFGGVSTAASCSSCCCAKSSTQCGGEGLTLSSYSKMGCCEMKAAQPAPEAAVNAACQDHTPAPVLKALASGFGSFPKPAPISFHMKAAPPARSAPVYVLLSSYLC